MSSLPLVSIIIPVHNAEDFLDECLQSVITQTYKNLEIIIVDDDSTDASKDIFNRYLKRDARVKSYSVNKHNAASTRRYGIQQASGSYICFADADDILHKGYVDTLYSVMQKTHMKITSGMIASIATSGDMLTLPEGSGKVRVQGDLLQYFGENYHSKDRVRHIAQSINAKLFEKSIFDSVDYSVLKTSVLEDNYILAQVLRRADGIALVDSGLYYYRQNPHSTMSSVLDHMIQYGDKMLSYPQLFDDTMNYVACVFGNTKEAISYADKIRVEEYFSLSEVAVDKSIRLIKAENELEAAKRFIKKIEDQRDALIRKIDKLSNSKSYKLGRAMTYPIRKLIKRH